MILWAAILAKEALGYDWAEVAPSARTALKLPFSAATLPYFRRQRGEVSGRGEQALSLGSAVSALNARAKHDRIWGTKHSSAAGLSRSALSRPGWLRRCCL
eukprot:2581424-Rhodomonas_salina.3